LEMVLVLVQDRCTVCAKCIIGSEIILDTPKVLIGDEAQLEASFGPSRDSANLTQDRCTVCDERTIRSEIVLDAPDQTPWWCGSCGILFQSVWRCC
jgi:hypothetical protein